MFRQALFGSFLLILLIIQLSVCQTPTFDPTHYENVVKELCKLVYVYSEQPTYENCYLKDGCDDCANGIEAPSSWKCSENQTLKIYWDKGAKGVSQPVARISVLEDMSGESD